MRIRPMAVLFLVMIVFVAVVDRVRISNESLQIEEAAKLQQVSDDLKNEVFAAGIGLSDTSADLAPYSANPQALAPQIVDGSKPDAVLEYGQYMIFKFSTDGLPVRSVMVDNAFENSTIGVYSRDYDDMTNCPATTVIRYSDVRPNRVSGDVDYTLIEGADWSILLEVWDWVCGHDQFYPSNVTNDFIGG